MVRGVWVDGHVDLAVFGDFAVAGEGAAAVKKKNNAETQSTLRKLRVG